MRITASHLVDWINTHAKEAQQNLPRLIRRLCFDSGELREIAFPSGDSTYVPGWDGVTCVDKGNAWLPSGIAYWEIGCDDDVGGKANRDYNKRCKNTESETRKKSTFVFVTPRRWIKKSQWVKDKREEGLWADVRVYDADDIEQWLEQSPAVAIQLAEELGLSGWGVMSPSRYWGNWSRQCMPNILPDAFICDRTDVQQKLKALIETHVLGEEAKVNVVLRADSVEEAAAFSALTTFCAGDAGGDVLIVTEKSGWDFVESNQKLKVAIAANHEVAEWAIVRDGLLVVFPHAAGDLADKRNGQELVLERPDMYEFEKALVAIGMEESDAKRFAASSGRSWTVFRRQRSTNPSLQRPPWLTSDFDAGLSVLCLVNAWKEGNEEDRNVVEFISGCKYEEVDRALRSLTALDDSPVLQIGRVWKAKSALELMVVFGGRIPSAQLDRFFYVAKEMLSATDPQLDLPDEERWMAQIHGKVRPYSGLLFESICSSLMKLASRGAEQAALQALNIEDRVAHLVSELLYKADDDRWLSLASYLPILAEAAPDMFLKAVEFSLRSDDKPVTRLIKETGESGLMGRCWHSGLLWALEKLAWSPRMLSRVALVLAQLSHVPVKGNWGNTPSATLHDIFRSWNPQTAASLEERIGVMDLLIKNDESAAFSLLVKLLQNGPQFATPANRPDWRDDDAGAGHGVTVEEMNEMVVAAKERAIELSKRNAARISTLLDESILKTDEELHGFLPLVEPFYAGEFSDGERNEIRNSLRSIIHWHRNYDDNDPRELDGWLRPVEMSYERLMPKNLIERHSWLFSDYWVDLPYRHRDDELSGRQDYLKSERETAIEEIYQSEMVAGITELVISSGNPETVGQTVSYRPWSNQVIDYWLGDFGCDFVPDDPVSRGISGYLSAVDDNGIIDVLDNALNVSDDWGDEKRARLLMLARPCVQLWDVVSSSGSDVDAFYWKNVSPVYHGDDDLVRIAMQKLTDAGRPLAALHCCQYSVNNIAASQLFDILSAALLSTEVSVPRLSSYHLGEMLEHLEGADEIDRIMLIQLEFALFPALGYGEEGRANFLYEAITSEAPLFNELIRLIYKPEHGEHKEQDETSQEAAKTAWHILNGCKKVPGSLQDETIDETVMVSFVEAVCEQGRHDDRLTMCEQTLGQILAHCKPDNDTWPPSAVSRLLDRGEFEQMRRGFELGTFNKRGVTSRSYGEGGAQERTLAQYYRNQAENIQHTCPATSTMLESIAQNYERHAQREDDQAGLRKEGF